MAKLKIGFIGPGEMGRWMSINIVKAGYDVLVCDINSKAVKFVTAQGAKPSQNPAELTGRVDCIFLSLPDTQVVETVIFGEKGIAQALDRA